MPKKAQLEVIKLPDRVSLYAIPSSSTASSPSSSSSSSSALFWQHMDDTILPTLRLVHQFPDAFEAVRVDRGAVRFVLAGATLMVPGLISKGGWLPGEGVPMDAGPAEEVQTAGYEKGTPVVVKAEGKEEICMVGVLATGTQEMRESKKGVAIEGGHYLGDGLWKLVLD